MVDVVESNRSMMVDVVESNRSAAAEEEREAETKAAEVDFEEEEGGDSLYAAQTSRFRDTWISLYSRYFGHFEDTSELFFILLDPIHGRDLSLIWYLDLYPSILALFLQISNKYECLPASLAQGRLAKNMGPLLNFRPQSKVQYIVIFIL